MLIDGYNEKKISLCTSFLLLGISAVHTAKQSIGKHISVGEDIHAFKYRKEFL